MAVSDDIKTRLDIVDVVEEYVPLKKAGGSFRALCPFHTERTASFYVFPDRQTWRCFGACATGGDLFSFVMKRENIGFGEAMRLLAQRAGVIITQRQREDENYPLCHVNEVASQFFQEVLTAKRGLGARKYLAERGVSPEAMQSFGLGLSPAGGEELKRHLLEQGHAEELLLLAGLVTKGQDGHSRDMFRGRLMFPIRNDRGQLVGFGGRVLDSVAPKYLNTPRTTVFDKSRILYGMDKARETIRQEQVGVVVEGYMDVIAAHQHSFTNVVASMGTSLTESQVALLQGLATTFVLAMDPDTAGQEATYTSLESSWRIFERRAVARGSKGMPLYQRSQPGTLKVAVLPPQQDPDKLIRSSPDEWQQLVNDATPLMDYLFARMATKSDLSTSHGKAAAAERMFPLIAGIENHFEQERHFRKLAELLEVTEEVLEASVGRPSKQRSSRRRADLSATATPFHQAQMDPLEEHTIALLLRHPELLGLSTWLMPEHFHRLENRAVFTAWRDCGTMGKVVAALDTELQEHCSYLYTKELPPADRQERQRAFSACLRRLEERHLRELKAQEGILLAELANEPIGEPLIALQEQVVKTNERFRRLFREAKDKNFPHIEER